MTGPVGSAPARQRDPLRTIRLVGVLAAVAGLSLLPLLGWGDVPPWAPFALAVAVAVSETAVVYLQFGRQRWQFSLTESVIGVAWVASTGAWSVVAVVAGVAVAQSLRHQPRLKLGFNVAMFVVAVSVGSLLAEAAGGGIYGAAMGMVGFWLLNHGLVGFAVATTSGRPVAALLLSSGPMSLVHTAGNSSIGLLAAFLAMEAPLGLLGLLVPLALLWTSYDQETRRSAEAGLFAELARGQEQATGRSSDVSAQVVVTAAARLLGGADVEMVLLAADGPVRYAGDETGVPERRRVVSDAFDEPWVLRALGERGVAAGNDDGRPFVSAVLGEADSPLAVLRACRPRGAAGFGRREIRLAQVLVGQAEAWLSVADLSTRQRLVEEQVEAAGESARALGDLGAATAPALTVLRESADRLARLAESSGGVDDIVEELHLVERAVASLLGAIALAAEPDLLGSGLGDSSATVPARPATDWTTTGVLR